MQGSLGRSYNCGKMVCISCIIRVTILRCDYPVLYVLRFYVVSTTILARILRCDPTFAEMSTWAFAPDGTCTRDPNMNLIIQYGLLGLVLGLGLGLGLGFILY